MKKLRIGIVGVGSIARVAHICSYNGMEDVEIVAVSDIVPRKNELRSDPRDREKVRGLPRDARKGIARRDGYLHAERSAFKKLPCTRSNTASTVFCEKPDAISFEERKRMSAAQQKSGKVLMVMRNNRHTAGSLYLKKCVDAASSARFTRGAAAGYAAAGSRARAAGSPPRAVRAAGRSLIWACICSILRSTSWATRKRSRFRAARTANSPRRTIYPIPNIPRSAKRKRTAYSTWRILRRALSDSRTARVYRLSSVGRAISKRNRAL